MYLPQKLLRLYDHYARYTDILNSKLVNFLEPGCNREISSLTYLSLDPAEVAASYWTGTISFGILENLAQVLHM